MCDKYLILKMEYVVNKILYTKNIINKDLYEYTSKQIDKLLFDKSKKGDDKY